MPQHLRDAAERRHQEAVERATTALTSLATAGEAVTFASVARHAGVSTDFLYRQPQLRRRIQELRNPKPGNVNSGPDTALPGASAPIRALSAQIKELRRRHHQEVVALNDALAAAQGENLALRRKLAAYE